MLFSQLVWSCPSYLTTLSLLLKWKRCLSSDWNAQYQPNQTPQATNANLIAMLQNTKASLMNARQISAAFKAFASMRAAALTQPSCVQL